MYNSDVHLEGLALYRYRCIKIQLSTTARRAIKTLAVEFLKDFIY
jgi:hypothetical protein